MRTSRFARPVVLRLAVAALLALCACATLASPATALDINTEVSLQDGEVGVPYEFQFSAEEGCTPYNFRFLAGTLPPGLTVQLDGKLVGTPTAAGTFEFWVELTDGVPGGACHSPVPSQGQYTVIIAPHIEITAALLGTKVGVPYSVAITTTGGGSLQWSITDGTLPPGLSLNRDTGSLAGTPSTVGTFPFTVKVADDKRRATKQFSFVVAAPLAVAAAALPAAEVGVPFTATIPFTGGIGPLAWSVGSGTFPGGLSLDPATGVVKGTPGSAGTFTAPVTVTDSDGQTVQVAVSGRVARRLAIATTRVAQGRVGKSYRARLATSGGVGPVAWSIGAGALPKGLKLSRTTGVISGTPRSAGTFRFTLRSTDRLRVAASRPVTMTIAARA